MKKFVVVFMSVLAFGFSYMQARVADLELPEVPSELRAPADRAAYVIAHFWDALDFSNDSRADDATFIEQNFSTWLSVFPIADGVAQNEAIDNIYAKASVSEKYFKNILDLAEKYLFSLDSPMASDEIYERFLNKTLASPMLDQPHKVRYRAQLEAVRKNRPGLIAGNITFETPEGKYESLYGISVPNEILLIFYDPDCDHCRETIELISADTELTEAIGSRDITVVAVYSGESKDLWSANVVEMPAGWITGYEDGTVQDDGTYILRDMPTLYLLDSSKRVILKETNPNQLKEYLTKQ